MKKPARKLTMSEGALVARCVKKLKSFPSVRVCCEVPILGRSVDLAYVREGELFTVEFKIHDWRRAIAQARDHLLGSDYSYICMPQRRVSDEMQAQLRGTGVGLVFYQEEPDWPFAEIIKAPPSGETWEIARAWAVEYIQENEGKA